ncbi:MAG: CHASE domain-containing protein, partial [Pseudomonadota bacterium]
MITRILKAFLPTIVIAAFGILVAVSFLQDQERHQKSNMKLELEELLSGFRDAIRRYEESINSVRGFYRASQFVDRSEFTVFVSEILENQTAMQAIEWIPEVEEGKREQFIESARTDGLTEFDFLRWTPTLGWQAQPDPWSRVYYPVFYVEPLQPNRAALGIDLGSHEDRLRAIRNSFTREKPVASDPIQLAQGGRGVLLISPIYRQVEAQSFSHRQQQGLILVVLNLNTFFEE